MKKTLILAGVLSAFAMSAQAQSSVTLYGSLDAGIAYANNAAGHSAWLQNSSGMSYNYFGLRGSEDLGGGLKAIFKLESGFDLSNGRFNDTNTMFNRQAYVGLQSDQFGTLTLGRQYDSVVDYLAPLSLAGSGPGANLAGHPFDNDNLDSTFSIKNAVKYTSANYAGFEFGGLYGFSNQPDGFSNGRAWSVGAKYANGPLNVAAGYTQLNNNLSNFNSSGATPSASESNIQARQQRTFGVGVNYAFGPAAVGFVWTHAQIDGLGSLSSGGVALAGINSGMNLHLDNFEVNGAYHLTPALAFIGSYTYTDGSVSGADSSNGSPKWHTVVLGSDYSLSKRTDVYLAGVYQHASGTLGVNGDGTPIDNQAAINTLPASSTNNQIAATVGLRHRF
jgi:general bacterial porin, GBP family